MVKNVKKGCFWAYRTSKKGQKRPFLTKIGFLGKIMIGFIWENFSEKRVFFSVSKHGKPRKMTKIPKNR